MAQADRPDKWSSAVYFKETVSKISSSDIYVELALIAGEKINRKIIPLLRNNVAGRFGDLTYSA